MADELGVTRSGTRRRSFGGQACSSPSRGLPQLASHCSRTPALPGTQKLRVELPARGSLPVRLRREDPSGTPAEFEAHVGAIAGPVTQRWVGGGHAPKDDGAVIGHVRSWLGFDEA